MVGSEFSYLLCWNGIVALDGVRLAVRYYDRSVHLGLRPVRDGGTFRGRLQEKHNWSSECNEMKFY